jgi:transposase
MFFCMQASQENIFSEIEMLRGEVEGLKTMIARKDERISHYEEDQRRLHEIISSLQRRAFGPKKERWESQEQGLLGLFNEAETEAKKPEEDQNEEVVAVKGFERKRGKRKPLPEHLPRRVVTVELPESERVTEDGIELKVIGKEISEKLVYEPACIEVIEYHRLRYGVDSGDPVKTAPPVPSIIPKGIATPSLLSGIVTNKYADGLPLYRQEEMFDRIGVDLSRGSMARWIIQAAEACMPVWNALEERFFKSDYVSCDETHTQVLKEKGRRAESKSWMWVRATPNEEKKVILFDYDPHRSGDVAKRLLADYRGRLQVDGYGAYNWTEKQDGMTRIGCNMHGRRGFEEAFKHGAKTGRSLAEQGLKYYQQLYDFEEEAKEKGLSWPERFEFRKIHCASIWDEMKLWATEQAEKVPPKSKIGEAFHYFLGEYELLRGYLLDGKLEMDNGFAERAIRKFAIGRNNWLFSDTEEGAHASALFYSFIVTAKLNGVNPYQALKKIFEQIPLASTIDDYERLADLLLSPAIPA